MNTDKIISLIQKILKSEMEVEIEKIETDKTLFELGIDSIRLMMLIVYIEDELSIEIDMADGLNEEYNQITIETLINAIRGKIY